MMSHIRSFAVAAMIAATMVVSAGADETQPRTDLQAVRLDPALTGAQ